MKKVLLFLAIFILAGFTTRADEKAMAFEGPGCMGKCTDCHTLPMDEAKKLLKTERFRADIKDIRMSPVKGLWEVEITQGPKTFVVYVDFGKKFLIEGRFTPLEKLAKSTKQRTIDTGEIPLDEAVVMGDPGAENKVIIFDDPECPYCARLHQEIKKVLAQRDDVAFFIKMYPLASHPNAYEISKTIVCSGKPEALDKAFKGEKLPEADCETDEVDNNIKLAKRFGIRGTPAIILPDGRLIPGYVTADTLMGLLDE